MVDSLTLPELSREDMLTTACREARDNGGYLCIRGRQCLARGSKPNSARTALTMNVLRSPAPHQAA